MDSIMKFKISLTKDEELLDNMKKKGSYPFHCGGIEWVEKTTHDCDDLTPFYGDAVYAKAHGGGVEFVDPRLIVETTKTKEEKENVKATSDSIGTDKLHTA